jgi:hypothetical protein
MTHLSLFWIAVLKDKDLVGLCFSKILGSGKKYFILDR